MIDRRRVEEKLAYLNEQVEAIAGLFAYGPDPATDPWVGRGLRYAAQTGIEAMIDIAYHVSAKSSGHVPRDAHDALDAALSGQDVPPDLLARWHRMIGLRNRLVHGYEQVSDERLVSDLGPGLDDFRAFAVAVLRRLDGE